MPNMDGTGPQGQGARTGRGLGKCDSQTTSRTPQAIGGGRGQGRGRGLGLKPRAKTN